MRLENYGTSSPSPTAGSQEKVTEMGRKLLEKSVEQREQSKTAEKFASRFEEKFLEEGQKLKSTEDIEQLEKTAQEDLQFGNNSALYTTAITDFIEREFEPTLVGMDVIKRISLTEQGKDSIKVPKQPDLQVASDVASDGTLTDDSADYTVTTIQTDFIGLVTPMTIELLKNANVDLMEDQLRQITNALERKVDADVTTEMENAATKNDGTYGSNNNFNYLGSGTNASYDGVVEAYYDMRANNADPDMFICSPEFGGNLFTEADMKDAVAFGTVSAGGNDANVVPAVQSILGFPVMIADQMSANYGLWVDTDRLGYLVDKTGIETMDQQLDGKAAFEVKAIKGFGVEITKPQAVYSVIEDTDEPA